MTKFLIILDDFCLLTGEIELFLKRTCKQCSARPVNGLALLKRTTERIADNEKEQVLNNNGNAIESAEMPATMLNTTLSLGDRIRYLPTGLPSIDCRGYGGVRVGSVTELVGRAGVGKTQFALQLILLAAKYGQGAMYIDTERKLILERLRDMSAQRYQQNDSQQQNGIDQDNFRYQHPNDILRNLTVKQPNSIEELLVVLESAEEEILHRNQSPTDFPVRLLVVDSITAPMKRDFASNAAPQRAAAVFSIAQTLKRYADQLHLAVVVMNQMGQDSNAGGGQATSQISMRAALGTSWHHCVSTRILMEHQVDPNQEGWNPENLNQSQFRHLAIVKSNVLPFTSLQFEITRLGVIEKSDAVDR